MTVEIVCIHRFTSSFEANIALAKLSSEGIEAFIDHDEIVLIDPGTLNSANIQLMVNKNDAEKAVLILTKESSAA